MCRGLLLSVVVILGTAVGVLGQWPSNNPTLPGWSEPVGIDCLCSDVSPRIANTETANTTCADQKDNCDQPFMLNSVKELAEGANGPMSCSSAWCPTVPLPRSR